MIHPKHLGAVLLHAAISHPHPHVRKAAVNALKTMGLVKNTPSLTGGGPAAMPPTPMPQGSPPGAVTPAIPVAPRQAPVGGAMPGQGPTGLANY